MENRGPYAVAYPTCPLNRTCHRGCFLSLLSLMSIPICTLSYDVMKWICVTFMLPKNWKVISSCNLCVNTIHITSCMGLLYAILNILYFLPWLLRAPSSATNLYCFTLSLLYPYRHSACLFTDITISLSSPCSYVYPIPRFAHDVNSFNSFLW